jgi:chromate transport protein ChrA
MNGYRNRGCSCARCRCSGYLWPSLLVTLGVLFLLEEYTSVGFDKTWPVILLIIGVVLLLQRNSSTAGHVDSTQIGSGGPPPPAGGPEPPDQQQVPHG